MKSRILLTTLFLLSASQLWAYDVEVDGIYYNLNDERKVAEVTHSYGQYYGDVIIPALINVSGTDYSVTSIGYEAFDHCYDLHSVTIPSSITSIDEFAFSELYLEAENNEKQSGIRRVNVLIFNRN